MQSNRQRLPEIEGRGGPRMAEGERQRRQGFLTTGSGQFEESYSQLVTGACDPAVNKVRVVVRQESGKKRGPSPSQDKYTDPSAQLLERLAALWL